MIDQILVADDEFIVRQLIEETVSRQSIEVVSVASGEEAIEELKKDDFQMAFVDLKMGKTTGMDVLQFCKENNKDVLFVMMTAYGTVETAIEALKLGAFDFVLKPFQPDQADVLIEKGKRWLELNERNEYLQKELSDVTGFNNSIIGDSPEVQEVMRLVQRVAPTDASVLISGESGTGKELVAAEIHRLYSKLSGSSEDAAENDRPYIRMNCAAVPENLLESELFGHEKGAFTGAVERRVGRFELADGGTLLLDEVGEIPLNMQAKLLRVLQEAEFERVGGNKTIKVNVRVIATTNRNLEKEVKNGNFREDLFYRLNVFPIYLPPLRERGKDIIEIANTFLQRQGQKLSRDLQFSSKAVKALQSYSWPGNIRELENTVERVAILEDGPTIGADALPLGHTTSLQREVAVEEECTEQSLNMENIERRTVRKALERTRGNRSKAAELLGFSVRTLRNKINEYRKQNDLSEAERELFGQQEA